LYKAFVVDVQELSYPPALESSVLFIHLEILYTSDIFLKSYRFT